MLRREPIHARCKEQARKRPLRSRLREPRKPLCAVAAAHEDRDFPAQQVQEIPPRIRADPCPAFRTSQKPPALLRHFPHHFLRIFLKQRAERIPDRGSLPVHVQKPGIIGSRTGGEHGTDPLRKNGIDTLPASEPGPAPPGAFHSLPLLQQIKYHVDCKCTHLSSSALPPLGSSSACSLSAVKCHYNGN